LLPAAHASEIAKQLNRTPDRDELSIVADIAHLTHAELERLRQRAIVQRAARTFEIEAASFRFDRSVSGHRGGAVDVREIIYAGARRHLSDQRMFADLRVLGARFAMTAEARPMLDRFGFTEIEAPILAALEHGTTIAEVDAAHREIDPRTARVTFYA